MLDGLTVCNIELTSQCNANCWMCGRRKIDRDHPEIKMNYGHMDVEILKTIRYDLDSNKNVIIQMHSNGDPHVKDALQLFDGFIRCFNTNGKLLVEKADEIIDNMETITISTFENDPEWKEQYENIVEFLRIKGDRLPSVIIRTLGEIYGIRKEKYQSLNLLIADRILHSPMGSYSYTKKTTVPEHGICMDLQSHLVIDRFGDVYPCVRFDPYKENRLGSILEQHLDIIWNGQKRLDMISKFIKQKRNEIPFCSQCEFWGIPRGK